jgi:adenosylcobinamide-phosphate synthase
MIGHKSERHRAFGWASARCDDLINLPASRLAALWLMLAAALVGYSARTSFAVVRRDARHHRSPNAGWPEAAMAGALGVRLSGPRVYDGAPVAEPWIGDGRSDLGPGDIRAALRLYRTACAVQAAALLLLILFWSRSG